MEKSPEWPMAPLENFLQKAYCLGLTVDLNVRGVRLATKMPSTMTALSTYYRAIGQDFEEFGFEEAKKLSEFAQTEIERNFPIIFGQAVVSLWSLLELCIKDFTALCIENDSGILLKDPFLNMKIKLGEYLELGDEERNLYLVDLLEREVGAGIKNGIRRFDVLLDAVDMGGRTPKKMNEIFFEFGQIRNALAHRGDRVDRKLLTSCPWLEFEVGGELRVTELMCTRYFEAAALYVTILKARSRAKQGIAVEDKLRRIFENYDEAWVSV